jgi:hypothetical protein
MIKLQPLRFFIVLCLLVGAIALTIGFPIVGEVSAQNSPTGQFKLAPLPYAYNALEPFYRCSDDEITS